MTELKTVTTCFKNPALNKLGGELIDLYQKSVDDIAIAQDKLRSSIERRFLAGKYLSENLEMIKDECGSQRAFGEQIGLSEGTLSNDKRAYEALVTEGITEVKDLIPYLQKKNIQANTFSWERMPKMLNEPDAYREKDRRPKDEKRVEQLYDEFEELKGRIQNQQIKEEIEYIQTEIADVAKDILLENPLNREWESEHYLNFVRSYGRDIMTGEPLPPDTKAHPHHVNPFSGGAGGGIGDKLPDCFTIPLHPDNHRAIHDGRLKFTTQEYLTAIMTIATTYIITYVKN